MDDIKRNNSDSDLSDDWNVIDAKDAPPVSESESIEVLEEDDDDEENDEINISSERLKETVKVESNADEEDLIHSDQRLQGAGDTQLIEHGSHQNTHFCVFPEEFHNVFTDAHYGVVNTSEVMCSISLIILCTVASSLMVISADNVMPSFLDVLVWQSLPDYQKDININNPGLISEQLKIFKDRNELLENKLNHLKLAVKAYEENMVSETALIEFVTDLQKSSAFIDEKISHPLSDRMPQKLVMSDSEGKTFRNNENKVPSEEGISRNTKYPGVIDLKTDRYSTLKKQQPVRLYTKLLSLFDTTSETGMMLNKASLLLVNSRDLLNLFQKLNSELVNSNFKDFKFSKLNSRLQSIENNFDDSLKKLLHNLSFKFYDNIKKFDDNLNNYVCKNIKNNAVNTVFNDWCVKKRNSDTPDKMKKQFKRENIRPGDDSFIKTNSNYQNHKVKESRSKSRGGDKYKHSKLYKTDEDTIGKSKMNNLDGHHETYSADVSHDNSKHFKDKHFNASQGENSTDKYSIENKINNKSDNSRVKKSTDHSKHEEKQQKNEKKKKLVHQKRNVENDLFTSENVKHKDVELKFEQSSDKHYFKDKLRNEFEKNEKSEERTFEKSFKDKKKDVNDLKKNSDKIKNSENHNKIKNFSDSKNNIKDKRDSEDKKYNVNNNSEKLTNINKKKEFQENKSHKKDKKYVTRNRNEKVFLKHKDKFNKKITFDDISRLKNDVLDSIQSYIDDMLMDLKFGSYYDEDISNNATSFLNSAPGDWFLTLGQRRSEIRAEKRRSDWLFDRAEGRHHLRDDGNPAKGFYEKTMWFFRRAWERNRYRY